MQLTHIIRCAIALVVLLTAIVTPTSYAQPLPPVQGVPHTHQGVTARTSPDQLPLDKYGRSFNPADRREGGRLPPPNAAQRAYAAQHLVSAGLQPQGGGTPDSQFFGPDQVIAPTGSWLESVDTLGKGPWPKITGITSYYFDPANDHRFWTWNHATGISYTVGISMPLPVAWPNSLESGDMNGDGVPDVGITTGYNEDVQNHRFIAMFGPDFTQKSMIQTGDNPWLVDLVRNGDRDVALITNWNNDYASSIRWDGTKLNAQILPARRAGFNHMAKVDFDGDGKQDVAVMWGQLFGFIISIYRNNGDGTFTWSQNIDRYEGMWPDSITFGNIQGDSRPEMILFTGGNAGVIVVYTQNSTGQYVIDHAFYGWGYSIADTAFVDDVDGNGLNDLVVQYSGGDVLVYPAVTPGVFGPFVKHSETYYATSYYSDAVRYVDMNGDGKKDLLTANYNYGVVLRLAAPALVATNLAVNPTTTVGGSFVHRATITNTSNNAVSVILAYYLTDATNGAQVTAISEGTMQGDHGMSDSFNLLPHGSRTISMTMRALKSGNYSTDISACSNGSCAPIKEATTVVANLISPYTVQFTQDDYTVPMSRLVTTTLTLNKAPTKAIDVPVTAFASVTDLNTNPIGRGTVHFGIGEQTKQVVLNVGANRTPLITVRVDVLVDQSVVTYGTRWKAKVHRAAVETGMRYVYLPLVMRTDTKPEPICATLPYQVATAFERAVDPAKSPDTIDLGSFCLDISEPTLVRFASTADGSQHEWFDDRLMDGTIVLGDKSSDKCKTLGVPEGGWWQKQFQPGRYYFHLHVDDDCGDRIGYGNLWIGAWK